MKQSELKHLIAEALPDREDMIMNPQTQIKLYKHISSYEAFKFGNYQAYLLLTTFYSSSIRSFLVAFEPGKPAYMVDEPEQFLALAKAEHLSLTTLEQARSYVLTYLDCTKCSSKLSYLVQNENDLRFAFDAYIPEQPQLQEQKQIKNRLSTIIQAPEARKISEGFLITVYTAYQQQLEYREIEVNNKGEISKHIITKVENNLPLVYLF